MARSRIGIVHHVDYGFLHGQIEAHGDSHVNAGLFGCFVDEGCQLRYLTDVIVECKMAFHGLGINGFDKLDGEHGEVVALLSAGHEGVD